MESNYLTYGAVMVITALVAAGLTFAATDQSDALDEQGQTIDDLTTSLNETEAAFADYRDSAESRMQELYDQRAELTDRAEEAEAELARYVQPVEADYSSTYEVNRSQDAGDQRVEDEFTVTVNEAAESFNLELGYDLVSKDSIHRINTAESIKVYDGNYVVGEVTNGFNEATNEENPVEFTATVDTKNQLEEFEGDYRVEIEHHFTLSSDAEGPEVRNVEFTATDTSDYFIYLE